MRTVLRAVAAVGVAGVVMVAAGCSASDQDKAAARNAGDRFIVPDNGGFEARLAAARAVENPDARDRELESTAFLAARGNYADVALGALRSLTANQHRDDVASRVALQLNEHRRYDAAMRAAEMIDDEAIRDRTFRQIAMLPSVDLAKS